MDKTLRLGFSLLFVGALIFSSNLSAQNVGQVVPGQAILDLRSGVSAFDIRNVLINGQNQNWMPVRRISTQLNIWLWEGPTGDELSFVAEMSKRPDIEHAQLNHTVAHRMAPDSVTPYLPLSPYFPNDSLFSQQWSLRNVGQTGGLVDADVDAPEAWDYATGGVSPAGDSVVIAVIDSGFDVFHPEWGENLWVNHDEIPGDGLDNDSNGFIDDFHGWNVFNQTDHVEGMTTTHGTGVAGIIGAKGDNGIGIAGVNWTTKLQLVAAGVNEAYIIEAYDYVLKSRRQYNVSQGAEGAFVVAVNCSFGTDFGQPEQSPLWCAMLDTLGFAGILTISATANGPWNVDEFGDLPTTCPSPFQISVTSLNRWDEKHANAAWGPVSIDLAAYGHEVLVLKPNGAYGAHTGTSFAAPHVSGAVGLIYAAHCPNLISLSQSNPAEAALWVKQLLLEHVSPVESIDSITVTGGRLNIGASVAVYQTGCQLCPAPYSIRVDTVTNTLAYLNWQETNLFLDIFLRWRIAGDSTWYYIDNVNPNFVLDNLSPCTDYEFSLKALCPDDIQSQWSPPIAFRTDGCCRPPQSVWIESSTENALTLQWESVTAAAQYHLRFRAVGSPIWNVVVCPNNFWVIEGLMPCTNYEFGVQTHCQNGFSTAFSDTQKACTKGCGSCTEAQYCPTGAIFSLDEWIERVEMDNGWSHHSVGGVGYQDFTANNQVSVPIVFEGQFIQMTLTPGYATLHYPEYFKVFIDLGMDGSFDEPEDLVLDPGMPCAEPFTLPLTLPYSFPTYGMTRMRIVMKYAGGFYTSPTPCDPFDFGQVEDYCIELSPNVTIQTELAGRTGGLVVYPSPAAHTVYIETSETQTFDARQAFVYDMTGRLTATIPLPDTGHRAAIDVSGWPSGVYWIHCGRWTGRLAVE